MLKGSGKLILHIQRNYKATYKCNPDVEMLFMMLKKHAEYW